MTTPPSKAELDKINAELMKLRAPQAQTFRPSPSGSMRSGRDAQDRKYQAEAIKQREDRATFIRERLETARDKARSNFEKVRDGLDEK